MSHKAHCSSQNGRGTSGEASTGRYWASVLAEDAVGADLGKLLSEQQKGIPGQGRWGGVKIGQSDGGSVLVGDRAVVETFSRSYPLSQA